VSLGERERLRATKSLVFNALDTLPLPEDAPDGLSRLSFDTRDARAETQAPQGFAQADGKSGSAQ
jgi:hypothetical protein